MEQTKQDVSTDTSRPFKKFYCDWRSRIFLELKGARLAVWMYHYLRSGEDGTSYPSLYLIAAETGYSETTVKAARRWLRKNGWLSTVEESRRDKNGNYKAPIEKSVFPDTIALPSSRNRTVDTLKVRKADREKIILGEKPTAGLPTAARLASEVDSVFEVDSGPVDSKRESRYTTISSNTNAVAVVDGVSTHFKDSTDKIKQTDSVLDRDTFGAELRKSHATTYCDFKATAAHIEQAWEKAQKVGPAAFIRAYKYWTLTEPEGTFEVKTTQTRLNPITSKTEPIFESLAWPLQKFLSLGIYAECVEKVRPYAHIARDEVLEFLVQITEDGPPLELTPHQISTLSAILEEYPIDAVRGGFFRSGGLEDFLAHAEECIEEGQSERARWRAKSATYRTA